MGVYSHEMGIKAGGKMAILAGAGPMGLGAVDYALHGDRRPATLVVSDIDETRLERARKLFPAEKAKAEGIELVFVNTKGMDEPWRALREMSGGGFDDVFVYAPVKEVAELASRVLGRDGCLNFFAGPEDSGFTAGLNYYDVHYNSTHVIGTTGGNTDDMREALRLSAAGRINPAVMVTHIGGLDSAGDAILNLPHIPGGKKLIYTHVDMPLTAISDFGNAAGKDPRFGELASITEKNGGLWNADAERYLLRNWRRAEEKEYTA
jgi:threonine dehydrogenase-like Zn-dependent dehydrogenase